MKRLLIFCITSILTTQSYAQSVGINENGNQPDPSAILDLSSNSKGLLIPRMKTGERLNINNPVSGLQVFDIEFQQNFVFTSGGWQALESGQSHFSNEEHYITHKRLLNDNSEYFGGINIDASTDFLENKPGYSISVAGQPKAQIFYNPENKALFFSLDSQFSELLAKSKLQIYEGGELVIPGRLNVGSQFFGNQKLNVAGKLSIADDGNNPTKGTIRYNSTDSLFQGYSGLDWRTFGLWTFDNDGPTEDFIHTMDNVVIGIDENNDDFIFRVHASDGSQNVAVFGDLESPGLMVHNNEGISVGTTSAPSNRGLKVIGETEIYKNLFVGEREFGSMVHFKNTNSNQKVLSAESSDSQNSLEFLNSGGLRVSSNIIPPARGLSVGGPTIIEDFLRAEQICINGGVSDAVIEIHTDSLLDYDFKISDGNDLIVGVKENGLAIGTEDLPPSSGLLIAGDTQIRSSLSIGPNSSNATGYNLSVEGRVICDELRVDEVTDWPDYVFTSEYDMMTLDAVGDFIKDKGHLPNVPSAKVVEQEGFDTGAMIKTLLEKIEELTLHTISQQKQIEELKNKIDEK